jgi:hypothetical protein
MSTMEDVVAPAVCAAGGAAAGSAVIAASGFTAAGMVGGGAGIGAAAGPVGMVGGALVGVAAYTVFRAGKGIFGWLCESAAASQQYAAEVREYLDTEDDHVTQVAVGWAQDWAEDAVELTGLETDQVSRDEVVASFDRWLAEMFDDQRPDGWQIWTSRVAAMAVLGADPEAETVTGVRLIDVDALSTSD